MKLCCFAMRTYDTPPKSKPLHTRVIEEKKIRKQGEALVPIPAGCRTTVDSELGLHGSVFTSLAYAR